jgi:hypothetical protein
MTKVTNSLKTNNNAFQGHIDHRKLSKGSVRGKIEVRVDERTLVYINPGKDKEATRMKYLKHIYGAHWIDYGGNMHKKENLQPVKKQ